MQTTETIFNYAGQAGLYSRAWYWNLCMEYRIDSQTYEFKLNVHRNYQGTFLRTRMDLNPHDVPLFFDRIQESKLEDLRKYIFEETLRQPEFIKGHIQYGAWKNTYREVDGKLEKTTSNNPATTTPVEGTKLEIGRLIQRHWLDFLYQSDVGIIQDRNFVLRSHFFK